MNPPAWAGVWRGFARQAREGRGGAGGEQTQGTAGLLSHQGQAGVIALDDLVIQGQAALLGVEARLPGCQCGQEAVAPAQPPLTGSDKAGWPPGLPLSNTGRRKNPR